jgi:outer membrane autotransporter protein
MTEWGSLTPEFKAAWVHDLSNTPISTSATLGGVAFTTETPRVAADGAQITMAATLQATDALSLRAEYDGDLRSAYQSQSGLVKFEWSF